MVLRKWAVAAIEEDIDSFFGTNSGQIVLALKEDLVELLQPKVINICKNITFSKEQVAQRSITVGYLLVLFLLAAFVIVPFLVYIIRSIL